MSRLVVDGVRGLGGMMRGEEQADHDPSILFLLTSGAGSRVNPPNPHGMRIVEE